MPLRAVYTDRTSNASFFFLWVSFSFFFFNFSGLNNYLHEL